MKQNLFANSILSRQSTLSNRSLENNVHMAVNMKPEKFEEKKETMQPIKN